MPPNTQDLPHAQAARAVVDGTNGTYRTDGTYRSHFY